MKIQNITGVFFSPAGHTEKVVKLIAERISERLRVPAAYLDFTLPEKRKEPVCFSEDTLVVFGSPTYAGRLPNKIMPAIREQFTAQGSPAVPVVTFGNRSFDDALAELRDILSENGFRPFAAAAAAGEHVFSDRIAGGRPDKEDVLKILAFADRAAEKLEMAAGEPDPEMIRVAGNSPAGPYYRPLGDDGQPAVFLKAKPKTDPEKCTRCGICAKVCPMGSVDPEDTANVPGICVKCQACVRKCPEGAKYFDDPAFLSHIRMLEKNFTRRAEPSFFI